jgi:hypothetical protein
VPRYYWLVIYDDMWGQVGSQAQRRRKDLKRTPLIPGLLNGYKAVHLDVELAQPEEIIWSGTLFSADMPMRVDWRLRPQSNLFADQTACFKRTCSRTTTPLHTG